MINRFSAALAEPERNATASAREKRKERIVERDTKLAQRNMSALAFRVPARVSSGMMWRKYILALAILSLLMPPATAAPVIYLVRHAEKARPAASAPKDPGLSAAGRRRARALADVLRDANLRAIYVTEFKRTQQTAEPTARAFRLQTTIVPAKESKALIARLKRTNGNALVVGHSNTIPEILHALGFAHPPQIDERDYDNLFVLVPGRPPQLLRLHYR